jgi:hypothetical protein
VDWSGLDIDLIPPGDGFGDNIDNAPDNPNIFDVDGHGDGRTIRDDRGITQKDLEATELAAEILKHPDFKRGMTVRLRSCYMAGEFAQTLANELGSRVLAASELVWARSDGYFYVAPYRKDGSGNFVTDRNGNRLPDRSQVQPFEEFLPNKGPKSPGNQENKDDKEKGNKNEK